MIRLAAALALLATPAAADLRIDHAMLRAAPAAVGGGYMVIHNDGPGDDVLLGAEAEVAEVQLHAMTMADGVMRMDAIPEIPLPAGEAVALAPGGLHLMLVGLEDGLREGDVHAVTLHFRDAGERVVEMPVRVFAEVRAAFADVMAPMHGEGH
ncbi:copper chaperone PCu(A)C [Jannaschia sp. W003]|uniref:copper chaperone PCu(A)C n=1 Tax=Jannaschia sp. W003 TaxID=2867012 RepID=UPI0021A8FA10|nr:copper chaperone PCu(A)C [Jannaschia sp. W003]UWQ20623.1 copper chaperone PCu(A)C [Jannaschia sp. W003]